MSQTDLHACMHAFQTGAKIYLNEKRFCGYGQFNVDLANTWCMFATNPREAILGKKAAKFKPTENHYFWRLSELYKYHYTS